jgi:hypothetical protein
MKNYYGIFSNYEISLLSYLQLMHISVNMYGLEVTKLPMQSIDDAR